MHRRIALVIASFTYAAAFCFAYIEYLNPVWDYFGFKYSSPDPIRFTALVFLITTTSMTQPTDIRHPAPLTLFILYINVYIPYVIVALLLDAQSISLYGSSIAAITIVFWIAGKACNTMKHENTPAEISSLVDKIIILLWTAGTAILFANYSSIIGFGSLTDFVDIYDQRVAGTATSPFLAYTQTLYSSVLVPGMLAIGIFRRRYIIIALALGGGILMFGITAQRTVLLLPAIIIMLHLAISSRRIGTYAAPILMAILSATFIFSATSAEDNPVSAAVALMLTFRTIAIPGLTLTQYEDLFSVIGHTYWSHVKGIELIAPNPSYAATDSLWPNLGYMVGDRIYGNQIFNVNANLFAGDGVAAAGSLGIIVIGAVFIGWLYTIKRASANWPNGFTCLIFVPSAVSLTNGHFFTTMLSFGGILWIALLISLREPAPQPIGISEKT